MHLERRRRAAAQSTLDTNLIVKVLFLSLVKICAPTISFQNRRKFSSMVAGEIDKIGNVKKLLSGLQVSSKASLLYHSAFPMCPTLD